MNVEYFIERLAGNVQVFEAVVRHVDPQQAAWKPSADKWSIIEVVNHLYDEEREDFRTRLNLTLTDPEKSWPPIDPPVWVVERRYGERELDQSLSDFIAEREKSLAWLRSLSEPRWEAVHVTTNGPRSAGDLLASWLAHDYLHIRQLTRLNWQYAGMIAAPYQTAYAGPWKES